MRAFLAVDLPRPELPGGGASDRAPFHLTLRFFGDVPPERLAVLTGAIRPVASHHAPFVVRLRGLGAFPSTERPRVVFVQVADGATQLQDLSAALDGAFVAVGLPPESRPFVPHATILRVGSAASRARAAELLDHYANAEFSSTQVVDLALKESTLTPGGAVHRDVQRFALGGEVSPRRP